MARKRMIDPAFWTDLDVGKLSRDARLLLLGLISNADDDGRIEAEPPYLRRLIFGYDEDVTAKMIEAWLSEIVTTLRSVETYAVAGRAYLWFEKWREYQKPKYPTASKLPAPGEAQVIPLATVATRVAAALRSIGKEGYSDKKITLERVQRLIDAYPDRDHLAEALAVVDWETAGGGESKDTKDGIARYRNWLKRADPSTTGSKQDDVSPRLRVSTPV